MTLANDVRYALRTLRKSPGFALTAVITMALGIGVTTAIFGVSDAMLWKPVPIPHLDTLAMVLERNPEDPSDFSGISAGDLADIRQQVTSLQDVASWDDGLANIVGAGGE